MSRGSCILAVFFATFAVKAVAMNSGEYAEKLRGVHPTMVEKYTVEPFTCLTSSDPPPTTIPIVNDDYCDCADGSDEPGTSACPKGSFFCRNIGFKSTYLSATFVNDGVCDCCDGSDEWNGHARCPDRCAELGGSMLAALEQRIKHQEEGAKIRADQMAEARTKTQGWHEELHQTRAKIEKMKPVVQHLKSVLDKLEAEEDAKQAEQVGAMDDLDEDEHIDEHTDHDDDVDWAQRLEWCNESEETRAYCIEEGWIDPDYSEYDPDYGMDGHDYHEETEEERGQRIAKQWTNNAEAAGENVDETEEERGQRIAAQWTTNPEAAGGAEADVGDYAEQEGTYHENHGYTKPADWDDAEDGEWVPPEVSEDDVDKAREQHNQQRAQLTNLESTERSLSKKIGLDFGPSYEFLSMMDVCVSLVVSQYNYKVCMFERASQDSVSLGTWEGFSGDEYKQARFTNGQMCPGGPARSLTVNFVCESTETKLLEISEPSRCEYAAVLSTPAACTPENMRSLQVQLAEMKGEPAPSHDEFR